MPDPFPQRIVCLTEEPTEVLYALGESHRIAGISRFTRRPPGARDEKPMVSAFTSAQTERILDLRPDLVVGFSDIQADIARDLIAAGIEVWISNHRTVHGIIGYVRRLGAMVGAADLAAAYADNLQSHVDAVRQEASRLPRRPRVYFEEWDDPMICGIRWVSEVIGIAGGIDIFGDRARSALARGPHRGRSVGGCPPPTGTAARLVVRQEIPAGEGLGPSRVGNPRSGPGADRLRDPRRDHPPARPGSADRRARRHP